MPKAWLSEHGEVAFRCPGCEELHGGLNVVPDRGRPCWSFNGNEDSPTLSPSVLIRSGHYADESYKEHCWCTYNKEHPEDQHGFTCGVCHSFVRDGMIQFLSDCTHPLAGQTVPLPEVYEGAHLEMMKAKREANR